MTTSGGIRAGAWICSATSEPVSRGERGQGTGNEDDLFAAPCGLLPMKKKTIRDLSDAQLRGKRALVRVDFNVPLDGERVTDDTRIRAALPTIQALLDRGARVVLLSHLGRPKGKPEPKYSLEPVGRHLRSLVPKVKGTFVESTDTDEAIQCSHDKGYDVILLENTRFLAGEEKNE